MRLNLTQRQLNVQHLLTQVLSNREIAKKLGLAAGTIKNYRDILGRVEMGVPLSNASGR